MRNIVWLGILAACLAGCRPSGKSSPINTEGMEERGYIAPLNDKVGREHVTFRNRYGIALAGDLYTA